MACFPASCFWLDILPGAWPGYRPPPNQPVQFVRALLLALIVGYQRFLSPLLGQRCRFYPSCSRYAAAAIAMHGAARGSYMAVCRVGRCHPGCAGGHDPVPLNFTWRPWRQPEQSDDSTK